MPTGSSQKSRKKIKAMLDDIIAYENGELDEDETVELFQQLVNSGLVWQLQGSYGRTAMDLINAGLIDA